MRKILGFFIAAALSALVFSGAVLAEESITITTYYPAPYGVYKTMRLFPQAGFVVDADCTNAGEMVYDNTGNQLLVCTGNPSKWQSFWTTQPTGGGSGIPVCADGETLVVTGGVWSCVAAPPPPGSFNIRDNEKTNQTCNAVCASYTETCMGIGTDVGATNWQFFNGNIVGAACFQVMVPGTCATVMSSLGGFCAGLNVRRTKCRCQT